MPKRQLEEQTIHPILPRQIQSATPSIKLSSQSLAPSFRQETPFASTSTDHSRSRPSSVAINNDKKTFWNSKGMDAFVDWLTVPDNHMRLSNPRLTSGKKPRDLYLEIANYVNSIHDTDWTHVTVKSKIQYAKKKYEDAISLIKNTGEEGIDKEIIRKKARAICPDYERFHAVYSSSPSKDTPPPPPPPPPPPKQSTVFSDQEVEDKDGSDNDNRIAENIPELAVEELLDRQPTVDEVESNIGEPERKRRQKNDHETPYQATDTMTAFATAAMAELTTRAKVTESSLRDIEEARQDLRQRERDSYQRMAENERRHQEMLDRRMQEFLEEKAEFKAKKEKFETIRDRLLEENAAMKRELEVRRSPTNVSVNKNE
ncbi:hypothetical protein BGX27_008186 [Mortierella sp. AM989]|nr:hypothetical protein BGX27_008186 [Mortierella sp. AM989]